LLTAFSTVDTKNPEKCSLIIGRKLENSWDYVHELGKRVSRVAEETLSEAAEKFPRAAQKIKEFRSKMKHLLESVSKFKILLSERGIPLTRFSELLSEEFGQVLELLKVEFGAEVDVPAERRIDEREAMVDRALEMVEPGLIRVGTTVGIEETQIREHYVAVKPKIKAVLIAVGELQQRRCSKDKLADRVQVILSTPIPSL